jgi:hypothetical protein
MFVDVFGAVLGLNETTAMDRVAANGIGFGSTSSVRKFRVALDRTSWQQLLFQYRSTERGRRKTRSKYIPIPKSINAETEKTERSMAFFILQVLL